MKHKEEVTNNIFLQLKKIKNYNFKIDGQNFFDQPIRNDLKTLIIFEKFERVKVMVTQLVVCWTMFISKTIIR